METYLEEEVGARLYDSAVRFASDAVTVQQVADNDSKDWKRLWIFWLPERKPGY